MPRQRDYRAEYQRRIDRGLKAGLSRTQARRSGPRGVTGFNRQLQSAVADIRHGRYRSPSEAANRLHLDAERLREYMKSTGQGYKEGNRVVFGQPETLEGTSHIRNLVSYHVPLISDGRIYEVDVRERDATLIGRYMSAVGVFIRTGRREVLDEFRDKSVADITGQNYPLETDTGVLTDIYRYQDVQWDEIYRRN
ncbi:MAG TPA: hypothetical protein VKU60_19855 [Chloroflexota bacterium]|nr:hypothetical protein [Chloroflexota bacterium]